MMKTILHASLAILLCHSASAQFDDAMAQNPELAGEFDMASIVNASRIDAFYTSNMDIDKGPGDVSFYSLKASSFLSKPIKLGDSLTCLGYLEYGLTDVDIDGSPFGVGPGVPETNGLHRVSLSAMMVYNRPGSRWFHGLYLAPSLRSDFGDINGDDFFLGAALGSAYRVSDKLVIGAGIYGSDLCNDPFVIGGVGFAWMPTEDWLVAYYGPRFFARRNIGDDNQLGFEIANHGGYWNVDLMADSSKLDLSSWRAGVFFRHRLEGELWLVTGAGMTFANELKLSSPGGDTRYRSDLDSAPYAYIGLSLHRW